MASETMTAANSRHFIDLKDISAGDLRHILDIAKTWKERRKDKPKGAVDEDAPLKDHALAMIFEKSSTRTRISFEMAMQQLGGKALILQGADMQLGRGETISDTAKVMSRYVDAVMLRTNSHDTVLEFAREGDMPVINALTDRSHPCQLMADMMTLEEHFGSISGRTFAWVGDGNNVATSLIEAAVKFDFELKLGCPESLSPDTDVVEWAKDQNTGSVSLVHDAHDAVQGADATFTDTWVSMGDKDAADRIKALTPFQVDEGLIASAKAEAPFLHCLPAHRGEEVTGAVIDGPNSLVWDEAENRLHAQKAILAWCLGVI